MNIFLARMVFSFFFFVRSIVILKRLFKNINYSIQNFFWRAINDTHRDRDRDRVRECVCERDVRMVCTEYMGETAIVN